MPKSCSLLFLLVVSIVPQVGGQEVRNGDLILNETIRSEVIHGILQVLNESYVFPDVAQKMEQAIRERQKRKEYDTVTSGRLLVKLLNQHLREVNPDKHLRIGLFGNNVPPGLFREFGAPLTPDEIAQERRELARSNFGFHQVQRLAGNIGYLELRAFHRPEVMSETAIAAMNFLANSDAVIIDLRQNRGGSAATVALISSYLFGPKPVHLNDLYWRPTGETHQWWTLPYVPGRRLHGKDVYVLTSSRTFSAAEEFAYNLKALERATIVGETTAGGAHPAMNRLVHGHFWVRVPVGRAINPVTKKNWEGTGVEPDVDVPADEALRTAHLMALEKAEARVSQDQPASPKETMVLKRLEAEIAEAIRELRGRDR